MKENTLIATEFVGLRKTRAIKLLCSLLLSISILLITLGCTERIESEPVTEPAPEATLYTVSGIGDLVRLNIVGESLNSVGIGNLGEPFNSSGVETEGLSMGTDGHLYAAVNFPDAESALYRINPQTAEATLVGPMGQKQVDGLSFAKNGSLYGVTSILGGGYASQLIMVDIKTGKVTPINVDLALGDLDALVIGPEDRVLVADGIGGDDQFYQIDLASESIPMPVGPTPDIIPSGRDIEGGTFGGRDIEGLTFGSDGFLYGTTNAAQTMLGISYLACINPETFEYVNLGSLEFGAWNLASALKKLKNSR